MARIREAHVAPLNQLVDQIADARVLPRSHIPYIDISIQITGGVQARALVMLDNPSTRVEAGTGSGLLSLDNDDRMARNLYEAYERHKIHWSNVLPVERRTVSGCSPQRQLDQERTARRCPWIREFLRRCPQLKIVLLLGCAAEDGWQLARVGGSLEVVAAPHCSGRGLSSHDARVRFEKAVAHLARALNEQ